MKDLLSPLLIIVIILQLKGLGWPCAMAELNATSFLEFDFL